MRKNDNYNLSSGQNSKKNNWTICSKKDKISIEHIKFILIGPREDGKRPFINQSLLLKNDKTTTERIGEVFT